MSQSNGSSRNSQPVAFSESPAEVIPVASVPLVVLDPTKKVDRYDRSVPPASGAEVVTHIPDYYALLELDKSASQKEIDDAYRYFVKRCHPAVQKHKDAVTAERNARIFVLYNEAYEVLGNSKARAVYDFYGGKAARNGILHEKFNYREGTYNKDNSGCFRNYNYCQSAVPKILHQTHLMKNLLESRDKDLDYAVAQPVVQVVHLTLEELYNGGIKTIKNCRRVLDSLSAGLVPSESSFELRILPGWTEGTQIVCPQMGPMNLCAKTSDLILQLIIDPHPRFRVEGYDLYATIQISLADVMGTGPIHIEHLDGRIISVSLTELASPNIAKVIKNEGLAKDEYKKQSGDLYIDFDITFPDEIDPLQKLELWVALVEYPRPRPPLHYAIAPISTMSLQRSDARQMAFEIPKLPPEPIPDAEASGVRFGSPESETLDPEDVAYRNKLGKQFQEDKDLAVISPENMEELEVGVTLDDGALEDPDGEQYVEDVEGEDAIEGVDAAVEEGET